MTENPLSKAIDCLGQALMMLGFLFVAILGTADGVPMAMPGVAVMVVASVLMTIAWAMRTRGRIRFGGLVLAVCVVGALGYFSWRAMSSPVRHFAQLDLTLIAASWSGLVFIVLGRWPVNLRVFACVLSAVAWVSLYVSWQQVFVEPGYSPFACLGLQRPLDALQASGFFFHQNPFGAFSAASGLLLLGMLRGRVGSKVERVLFAFGMLASFAGVYLSFSRAAMLGAVVGLAVWVGVVGTTGLLRKNFTLAQRVGIIITMAVTLTGIAMGAMWSARKILDHRWGTETAGEHLGSLESRDDSWRLALDVFQGSPIVGEGSRGFEDRQYDYWAADTYSLMPDYNYAHNEYLQTLSDYGIVGGGLALLVLVACVVRAVILISRGVIAPKGAPALPLVWQGAFAGLCALAADAVFSFNLHFVPVVFVAGALIGLMIRNLAPEGERSRREVIRPTDLTVVVALACIVMVVGVDAVSAGLGAGQGWWRWQLAENRVERGEVGRAELLEISREISDAAPGYQAFMNRGELAWRAAQSDDLATEAAFDLAREAEYAFDQAAKCWPAAPLSHRERGAVLLGMGRFAESEAEYVVAIRLSGHRDRWFTCTYDLGMLYLTQAMIASEADDLRAASGFFEQARDTFSAQDWPAVPAKRDECNAARKMVDDQIAFLKNIHEWHPGEGESADGH